MPTNLLDSLPRVAPLPRVCPAPPVIRPAPLYPSTSCEWKLSLVLNHFFDASCCKQTIDNLIAGPMNKTWLRSTANDSGRLAKGIPGRVRGTDCAVFISKDKVTNNKKVTYANMVCDYRPLKYEPYHVRLTICSDKLDYDKETASPSTNLLETKLLINSVLSDAHKGARFLGIDIKDFFLLTFNPRRSQIYAHTQSLF